MSFPKTISLTLPNRGGALDEAEATRLSMLETLVVSVLASDIGGGKDTEEVMQHRARLIQQREELIAKASAWRRLKSRFRRSPPRPRMVGHLLTGSDLWRRRGLVMVDAAAFEFAEELAWDALEVAGDDPYLAASALSFTADAMLARSIAIPDFLDLELAQMAASAAVEMMSQLAEDMAPSDALQARAGTMFTHCSSIVHGAERVLSKRWLGYAADALLAADAVLIEAGLTIDRPGLAEVGAGDALGLAIRFALLHSRLSEIRYQLDETDTFSDLDEALSLSTRCCEIAAAAGAHGGVVESAVLFSRQWFRRYHTGAPEAMQQRLISALRDGLLWSTPGSVECVRVLLDWGEVLYAIEQSAGNNSAGLVASLIFRRCCEELERRDLEACVAASIRWAGCVAGRADQGFALEAYERGMRAARRLTRQHAVESHRLIVNASIGPLHSYAAAELAATGNIERAAEVAEAGRSVTIQELFATPTRDLDELRRAGHSPLVDEYLMASAAERQTLQTHREWDVPVHTGAHEDRWSALIQIRAALERRRAAEEAIRALSEYQDFPRTLSFEDIRQAAHDAPIAYVVPGTDSGAIILIRGGAVAPEYIRLPLLTADELNPRALAHIVSYREWADRESVNPDAPWDEGWPELVERQGEWLWDAAVGPLLARVGDGFVRVVPLGLLMALPIQTAWKADRDGRRIYPIDRGTFSFVPSVAALRHAQGRPSSDVWHATLVDDPEGEFEGSREIEAAAACFPGAIHLKGEQAARAPVLEAVQKSNFAHISAHGFVDETNPRNSGIILSNGAVLTLDALRSEERTDLEVLVLSSCESAIGGGRSLDQGMSFPGLMYGAAAKSVIAAQWAVDFVASSLIFEAFYRYWDRSHDPEQAATALRQAQLELRDSDSRFAHPLWWGGFIHVG